MAIRSPPYSARHKGARFHASSGGPRPHGSEENPGSQERRWRLNPLSLIPTLLSLIGLLAISYPSVSSWISQYNQSKVIAGYEEQIDSVVPGREEQLRLAHEYNNALSVGALLEANANVPSGNGSSSNEALEIRFDPQREFLRPHGADQDPEHRS